MYRADYHIHTSMSPDSGASIASQIETAISKNLDEIAITDHFEYDQADNGIWQLTMDLENYYQTLLKVQEQYSGQIGIKKGIEVGYETIYHKQLNEHLKAYDFDFIICSTHKCEHQELALGDFYKEKSQDEVYRIYFEHVLETVTQYDHFDVYAHLDYVNRYGDYVCKVLDPKRYSELIEAILEQLVSKNKGLEVNTSGIRYGLGTFNPQAMVLKRYYEKGGRIITIGSDAHCNEHVGYLRNEAALMLKNIGFKEYTTFENRIPIFHKL